MLVTNPSKLGTYLIPGSQRVRLEASKVVGQLQAGCPTNATGGWTAGRVYLLVSTLRLCR